MAGTQSITVDSGVTTMSGVLSGASGALTKLGDGDLNLTGTSTYGGATTVTAGTLFVNGAISSDTTIGASGTLGGTGTVTGTVVCNGTVAPGNSIGTISIVGDYTQATGSTLEAEVSPTDADRLNVTGAVTIEGGTTLLIVPQAGSYNPDTTHVLISASGGIAGTFTTETFTSALASGQITYTPTQVLLQLSVQSFQSAVKGFNAVRVARVVNNINDNNVGGWSATLTNLINLDDAQLEDAMNQLVPAQLKGNAIIQENNIVRVRDSISYRMQNVLNEMHCKDLACQPCTTCFIGKIPLQLWVNGFNAYLHQPSLVKNTNPQIGYRSNTGGGTLGGDINYNKIAYLGLMGGGTGTSVTWDKDQGSGLIYSRYLGLYASLIGSVPYINASVITAWNYYNSTRRINYVGHDSLAKNKHHGKQIIGHFDVGFNFNSKGLTVRPFNSLDYIVQKESEFSETGSGILDLDVNRTIPKMLRNEMGINLAYCVNMGKRNRMIMDGKLSWVKEVRRQGMNFESRFQGYSEGFITEGYWPNRSLLSPGGSMAFYFCDGSAFVKGFFDAEFAKGYRDTNVGAEVGIHF